MKDPCVEQIRVVPTSGFPTTPFYATFLAQGRLLQHAGRGRWMQQARELRQHRSSSGILLDSVFFFCRCRLFVACDYYCCQETLIRCVLDTDATCVCGDQQTLSNCVPKTRSQKGSYSRQIRQFNLSVVRPGFKSIFLDTQHTPSIRHPQHHRIQNQTWPAEGTDRGSAHESPRLVSSTQRASSQERYRSQPTNGAG